MTEHKAIDGDRLRRLLEAYGAEPARWPEAERQAALTLLATHSNAVRLRAEAAELDAWLDEAAVPQPSPELMADVLAAASPSPWRRWAAALWPFGPIWRPASALALACALGILAGSLVPGAELINGAQLEAEIDSQVLNPRAGIWSL